ncbi:MAG: DUF1552 domain-containing protein [Planctomycetota bacterium]
MPQPLDRRTVLRGLGTALALPLLESMTPRAVASTAAASASTASGAAMPPLRMAFLYVPNGMHMPDWTPQSAGGDPTGTAAKIERLDQLPKTLDVIARHRSRLSVLSGLTLDGARAHGDGGGDHARSVAAFLTGAHPKKTNGADIQNGVSVDQVAAAAIGDRTPFSSLELGLEASAQAGNCDSGYSCAYASNMSWRGPTNPVAKEIDPGAVFDRLFAGQIKSETKRAKSVREKYRKSILDFALQDAKRLHAKLPTVDRRKLEEYLYSVREIEKRLGNTDRLDINESGVPDYPRPSGVPRQLAKHAELMLDVMTLAMQTDNTRILSFMFANAGSNRSYPEIDVNEGHHESSHHGKSPHKQANIAAINRFHIERLGYFLDRLAAIPEGDGTLLDHSMIVYGSGISDGDRHNHDDLPILMAGGGGQRMPLGQHLRYRNGTPLCNLYLWMMQQMGVPADQFGDSTGVLSV